MPCPAARRGRRGTQDATVARWKDVAPVDLEHAHQLRNETWNRNVSLSERKRKRDQNWFIRVTHLLSEFYELQPSGTDECAFCLVGGANVSINPDISGNGG